MYISAGALFHQHLISYVAFVFVQVAADLVKCSLVLACSQHYVLSHSQSIT